MFAARRLLAQRYLAALIYAAALLLRLLVPTGYMIGRDHGRVAITLCSGVADQSMMMAMPGLAGEMSHHGKDGHGRAERPCAFAGLAAPALGGADPLLLAIAIAFIMAVAFLVPAAAPSLSRCFLRPPLRGPPAIS